MGEIEAPTSPSPTITSEHIRPASFAGTWYPGETDELAAMVDNFLDAIKPVDGEPIALIVPHAGYIFSGPVAASGFKQLEDSEYEVAIVIASDHNMPLSDPISIYAKGGFETPLGIVDVDEELAEALITSDPLISFDPASHEGEHPIEIELPFLQRVCPSCSVVPVLIGSTDEEAINALTEALLSTLPGKRAVIVASSDLSHYPSAENAIIVDGVTLAAIETGNPTLVQETIDAMMMADVPNLATCACGEAPILVAMRAAQGLGANTISILAYANSSHSPYGNQEQVVGYGAVMIWDYEPPELNDNQRNELLELARTAISEYIQEDQAPDHKLEDPAFSHLSGVFVTLKSEDQPRGCIGYLKRDLALYRAVQEMAVAAATSDPRLPPITLEELDKVSIEISILSPLKRIIDFNQIVVGTHGLVIFHDGHQGVLLPQVPVEQGWDREAFLENLCEKAGLDPECWTEEPTIYTFTAVVFEEN